MKFQLVALLVLLAISGSVYSAPMEEIDVKDLEEYGGNMGVRQRRITCDLLSADVSIKGFGGKVNDSACAANCLSMGKAGGRCNSGICQCRTTTFKDLWNKRFG